MSVPGTLTILNHPWGFRMVSVISGVIHQGLQVSFVVIGIRLRTAEGSVQSDADLFEEGVNYVVDQKHVFAATILAALDFFSLHSTSK